MPNANNSFATATAISGITSSSGYTGSGALSTSNNDISDYYSFKLSGTSNNLQVSLQGLTANAKVSIFDGSQNQIATSNNSGTIADSLILNNLNSGTYYVRVDLGTQISSANYNLSVLASSALLTNTVLWRDQAGGNLGNWQLTSTTLSQAQGFNVSSDYTLIGSGDFNGDGIGDLVWRNLSSSSADYGKVFVWWTDGLSRQTGSAAITNGSGTPILVGSDWVVSGIKDLDGNGTTDLLWRNLNTGDIATWFIGQNSTTKQPVLTNFGVLPYKLTAASGWDIVGVENLDGQYGADLLWRNRFDGTVAVWTLNSSGTGVLSANVVSQIDPSYQIVGFKDLNGDGKADILWRNNSNSGFYIWQMDGSSLVKYNSYTVPTSYQIAQVADLNGDRRNDIVWRNLSTGDIAIWVMGTDGLNYDPNATGFATYNGAPIKLGSNYTLEGAKDFSGDGKADLLWRDTTTGDVYVWSMNGYTITNAAQLNNGFTVGSSYQLPAINYGSYQETQFLNLNVTNQALSIAGSTSGTAFDIGTLLGTGTYSDSVSKRSSASTNDFYKFEITNPTVLTMSVDNASVSLQLLDSNLNPISYTGGTELDNAGTYYIKAIAGGTSTANLAYNLTVKGEPVFIDLLGSSFSLDQTAIALPNAPSQATVNSTYTVENDGSVASGSFTVKYYLSRDGVIDSSDTFLTSVDIASLAAHSTQTLNTALTLPAGDAYKSWNIDGTYYIGVVIVPGSNTNESNLTNDANLGQGIDLSSVQVTNVQTSELVGDGFTVTSGNFTPGSTITANVSIENLGQRDTSTYSNFITLNFVLSADQNIDPNAGTSGSGDQLIAPDTYGINYDIGPIAGASSGNNITTLQLTFTLPEASNLFWNQFTKDNTAKNVYLGVVIDIGDKVFEPNETNNYNQGVGTDIGQFQVVI